MGNEVLLQIIEIHRNINFAQCNQMRKKICELSWPHLFNLKQFSTYDENMLEKYRIFNIGHSGTTSVNFLLRMDTLGLKHVEKINENVFNLYC